MAGKRPCPRATAGGVEWISSLLDPRYWLLEDAAGEVVVDMLGGGEGGQGDVFVRLVGLGHLAGAADDEGEAERRDELGGIGGAGEAANLGRLAQHVLHGVPGGRDERMVFADVERDAGAEVAERDAQVARTGDGFGQAPD